jgi:hypothetical protein
MFEQGSQEMITMKALGIIRRMYFRDGIVTIACASVDNGQSGSGQEDVT